MSTPLAASHRLLAWAVVSWLLCQPLASPFQPILNAQMLKSHILLSDFPLHGEKNPYFILDSPVQPQRGIGAQHNLVSLLAEIVSAAQMAWPWPGVEVSSGQGPFLAAHLLSASPPTSLHSS